MRGYPTLNFPGCTLRMRRDDAGVRVWDTVRRAWVALTPEEWVRQHMLRFLTEHMGVAALSIRLEYPVCIQGMPQRADAVVIDRQGNPVLLVECKSPDVDIDASVYAQAVRYNNVVGARFMMLTNGMKHYCYAAGGGGYTKLDSFPHIADDIRA